MGSPWEPVQTTQISPGGSFVASSMSITLVAGTSIRPISRARLTFLIIDRPTNATLRPVAIAASATCCTRCRCDAKLATMMRLPSWSRNSGRSAAPTVDSEAVKPGRSALVLSESSMSTPPGRLAISPNRARSVRRPSTGVRSILKSPLCRIVPCGVWYAAAKAWGTEWVTGMNSTSKGPIWRRSPSRTGISCVRSSRPASSMRDRARPSESGEP